MRTKRDDIKRKYNEIFREFAGKFETEMDTSEKPLISTFNGYKEELYHNFYFQFKNGIKFYAIISDAEKKLEFLSVNAPNPAAGKKLPQYFNYIDEKLSVTKVEGVIEGDKKPTTVVEANSEKFDEDDD